MSLMYIFFAGIIGLMVGSFLNVAIYRIPIMLRSRWINDMVGEGLAAPSLEAGSACEQVLPSGAQFNLIFPRSHCTQCKTSIPFYHNIPLISWLLLRGRCGHCQQKISWRYPLVEVFTGLAMALAFTVFSEPLQAIGMSLFFCYIIVAVGIDLDCQLLPDEITWPLMMLGLLFGSMGVFISVQESVLGALIGYYILWVIYFVFLMATGREGFGFGDFRLLCAIGAWTGWKMIPILLLIASVSGLMCAAIAYLCEKHKKKQGFSLEPEAVFTKQIPFGPHLALGAVISLLASQFPKYGISFYL